MLLAQYFPSRPADSASQVSGKPWWCHDVETLSVLLVTGDSPHKRPVMGIFGVDWLVARKNSWTNSRVVGDFFVTLPVALASTCKRLWCRETRSDNMLCVLPTSQTHICVVCNESQWWNWWSQLQLASSVSPLWWMLQRNVLICAPHYGIVSVRPFVRPFVRTKFCGRRKSTITGPIRPKSSSLEPSGPVDVQRHLPVGPLEPCSQWCAWFNHAIAPV